MIPAAPLPPYALATPVFRFRALASLAGRAPLGGPRELAIACFIGARLAAALTPGSTLPHDDATRAARATGARAWLASAALPAPTRASVARLFDTTGRPLTAAPVIEAAPPPRRTRRPSRPVPEPTETAVPRDELMTAVASALAAVAAAAEPWLDAPSRLELLQLARELAAHLPAARASTDPAQPPRPARAGAST